MALTEIGCDAGVITVQITGYKKDIIGVEKVTYGVEHIQSKTRGAGGGWHRGYAGPGQKQATDGTLTLWHNTYNDWLSAVGGESNFLDLEFNVTIITVQANNPTIKTKLKSCRPLTAASSHDMQSTDNMLVEFSFSIIRVETTVG